MKILKFGGSSVGNADRINQVIDILGEYTHSGIQYGVVFSAFQTVTDRLISLGSKAVSLDESYKDDFAALKDLHIKTAETLLKKNRAGLNNKVNALLDELGEILYGVYLVKELTPRTLDFIMSFGERLSCSIISGAMNDRGFDTEFLDARKLVKTDDNFGSARVNFEVTDKNISAYFAGHKSIQIITGFIGSTEKDETVTLGRGGSDYTASIFGAALDAEEIEIWTDVDGIFTADPRRVVNAYSLKAVTYEEAMELSHFGAKVIHPPTMRPALNKKIRIRIKNTFNPSFKGTVILERDPSVSFNVKGISSIDDVSLLQITGGGMVGVVGIASRIFGALARENINVILITQASSEHSVCLAVLPAYGAVSKKLIEEEFKWEIRDGMIDEVSVEPDMSVIAVVGEDMKHTPGISGKVFQALGKNGINIHAIAQGSSELNISLVIAKQSLKKAMNVLHDSLFLSRRKTLNLFLVGTGNVGSAFIRTVNERNSYMQEQVNTDLRITGIADSKKMLFDEKGIGLEDWRARLNGSNYISAVPDFIAQMKKMNLPNSILVDCTANDSVVKYYTQILSSSISIVTPNKIANTQSYDQYKEIRETAAKHNIQFRYGTNVCSALPVINTLKDMIANGDQVIRIEGVFSGTLSYLFNSFRERDSFSQIVREAKDMGFTEPDPRDDLKGLDMARKLLILMRESGIRCELSDIKIEKLISDEALNARSIPEFFDILQKDDAGFSEMKKKAAEKGNVLCYLARYEDGKAGLGIEEIGKDHPFFNLVGSENIVSLTTKNYIRRPLTIKGPGGGAEFTSVGILSDILRISNYLG